jgi:hypothetical protein
MTMPTNKDLKRLVRARMDKTGEAYTAALAQLIRKPDRSRTTRPVPLEVPAPDYARLAGMADAKVKAKTGRTWEEWTRVLDSHNASAMIHREVAQLVSDTYGVPDWWTQTVTVGYERIKGLRARGQRRDGTYEASKSRTYDVPVTRLFDAWANGRMRGRWLQETGVKVRTATRPKTMRLGFADGTIVAVGFLPKGKGRSSVSVQHTKLPDRTATEGLKRYWTEKLAALGALIDDTA